MGFIADLPVIARCKFSLLNSGSKMTWFDVDMENDDWGMSNFKLQSFNKIEARTTKKTQDPPFDQ